MILRWRLPLESLSASSLSLAIQCPEQFRQKYIVRPYDSDVMFSSRFMGTVDHRVNELIFANPDADIDMLYRRVWNEEEDKVTERGLTIDWRKDDPVKMMEIGAKMAHTYHRAVKINPVAMEEKFEVRVQGVPVPIKGRIDMIEPTIIRERKTNGVKATKPKPKWRFQGLVYQFALGMPLRWDIVTRQVTPQVFLAEDWPDLYLPIGDMKVTEQLVRDAARRVNDLYAQYGADHPWPMDGLFGDWLCDYCVVGPKYENTCPAWAGRMAA